MQRWIYECDYFGLLCGIVRSHLGLNDHASLIGPHIFGLRRLYPLGYTEKSILKEAKNVMWMGLLYMVHKAYTFRKKSKHSLKETMFAL